MIRRRALAYWLCQVTGWLLFPALGLLYSLTDDARASGWTQVLIAAGGGAIGVGWTHLYRRVIRRRGWGSLAPGRLLARVIPASLLLGVAITYTMAPVFILASGRAELVGTWTPAAVMGWSGCAFAWNIAYFGIHYFERWQTAETDKLQLVVAAAEARLHGLMAQVNPHFLFNCLNSVRALILEDPARAQAAVTALSALMRSSLTAGRIPTVPLETEIEMVRSYLLLEGIRLEERLIIRIEIAAATQPVPIPTMLVQSLVENGVKHGIERLPAGGTLGVASWLDGGVLRVRVTNSGRLEARTGSTGLGLANARERLRLLYGGRASLELREDGRTVVAELALPVAAEAA